MKLINFYFSNRIGYLRFKDGYGFHFKDTRVHPLLFSQRVKKMKYIKIGNWVFTLIKP